MKATTEIVNRLTEMLDKVKTSYELAMIVETMMECYSQPVVIAALMSEIIDLKGLSFNEDEEEEGSSSCMS